MPIHTYANWNNRLSDGKEQIEPFRKYFFICEGANTETYYFRRLIDLRKELGIHSLIDIRLWEKTEGDKDKSFPKNLARFAEEQKDIIENGFDKEHDKMIIVFDGDIFEEKVLGYDELVFEIENNGNIVAVTNPNFELYLILHINDSYEEYIKDKELEFLSMDEKGRYSHSYNTLLKLTGMNAKSNSKIGELADNLDIAIKQEKRINQDIHKIKGRVSSNVGRVIEAIINDKPDS